MASITYEGSEVAAIAAKPAALKFLEEVRTMKRNLGINQMIKTRDLPDGTSVSVVSLEHVDAVHIIAPTQEELDLLAAGPRRDTVFGGAGVPDYVCGAATSHVIEDVEIGTDDNGDPVIEKRLKAVKLTELGLERHTEDQAKAKLAVQQLEYFKSDFTYSELVYSQHRTVRPGYYTGGMRKLVQVLLGIGIQTQDTYERRAADAGLVSLYAGSVEFEYEDDYFEKYQEALNQLGQVESPYALYDPTADSVKVEVYYDWRAHRTHGIHIGKRVASDGSQENAAYVIELSSRGASAWPLELDPFSVTSAGRAQYEALYPELFEEQDDGTVFFDYFGGFPTPYSAPRSTEMFEKLVRAGEIVQGLDSDRMATVYSKQWYSTAHGWAFNLAGTEAHNTCHSYDASGLRVGHHYMVTISVTPLTEELEPAPNAQALIDALELAGWEERKANRLTEDQIDGILIADDVADAFDQAVARPPFTMTANLVELKKGMLYHPGRLVPKTCGAPSGQPQYKVWEPVLDCEVSFDFGVDDEHKPASPPTCDTPIFVCWNRQGGLTVLNYSWKDQRSEPADPETTREFCQYEGTWTTALQNEVERVAGNFYSSDWDPRESLSYTGGTFTKTTGTFLGNNVCFSFYDYFSMCCQVELKYYHSYYSETTSHGARGNVVSTAVPKGDRQVLYMMKYRNTTDQITSRSQSGTSFSGHGAYYSVGFIFEWVFHWVGISCPPNQPGCPNEPITCHMRPACPEYRPHTFSCFDGKPDFPEYRLDCPNGYRAVPGSAIYYSRCDGEVPQVESWFEVDPAINSHAVEVRMFGDHPMHGRISHKDEISGEGMTIYDLRVSQWWFAPSPDACDSRAYLFVCTNQFGRTGIGYETQFDGPTEFSGLPAGMQVALQSCYVGYVS